MHWLIKFGNLDESFIPMKVSFHSVFYHNVEFLVSKLESIGFQQNSDAGATGWVVRALLDVKVPYALVFQVYHDLFETKLPPWSSPIAISFLVQNIAFIIEFWFEHIRSPSVGPFERYC
jgi:hypothetical protein